MSTSTDQNHSHAPGYEFRFIAEPSAADLSQILGLYKAAGWWKGPEDDRVLTGLIRGSHCFLTALQKDRIVAMGRAISDRASDAYIQDVTVLPEHRGRALGSAIVARLVNRLKGDGISWVGLIAERNSHAFYTRLGFEPMPDSQPMLFKGSY